MVGRVGAGGNCPKGPCVTTPCRSGARFAHDGAMPEIEIKLEVDPARRDAVARVPALARVAATRHKLLALYFDTPGAELARRRMSLRLRRDGDRWVRTFKAGGSAAGGLHSRDEWEESIDGPILDLAALRGTPLAGLPDAHTLHERLAEAFRVRMDRTTWQVKAGAARLEVALDVGEVRRGERTTPVCELEIELLEGDPDAAFAFALALVEHVPMRPGTVSKAARGYRLVAEKAPGPVGSVELVLDAGMTPAESARRAMSAGLAQ